MGHESKRWVLMCVLDWGLGEQAPPTPTSIEAPHRIMLANDQEVGLFARPLLPRSHHGP